MLLLAIISLIVIGGALLKITLNPVGKEWLEVIAICVLSVMLSTVITVIIGLIKI